jgi:hypothetical protein
MLPFAKTGTETASFTARTFAQSATPYSLHLMPLEERLKESTYSILAALLTSPAMARKDLCSSALEHFRVFDRLFQRREYTELRSDWYGQIHMQSVY